MERDGLNELVRSSRSDCEEYNRSDAILVEKSQIRRRVKKLREVRKRKRLGEDGERSGDEESKKAATVSDRRATSPISSIMSLVEEYFRGLLVVYFLRRKKKNWMMSVQIEVIGLGIRDGRQKRRTRGAEINTYTGDGFSVVSR